MSASLYSLTIPAFLRGLQNLAHVLKKGQASKGDSLLTSSIAPDMKDLIFQVQTVCNTAKFLAVRVGGVENEVTEDSEKTFEDLLARIDVTIAFLKKTPASAFDGKDGKALKVKLGPNEYDFTGESYVVNFAMPNFWFHAVTAYDILRKEGVDVGKMDFLAGGAGPV